MAEAVTPTPWEYEARVESRVTEDEGHPIFLGPVVDVKIDGFGILVVEFEGGATMATRCPDWFREMDDDARERWRQVEGALYWPEVGESMRLPQPKVDPLKLAQAIRDLTDEDEE
jgi:hypothetical protein